MSSKKRNFKNAIYEQLARVSKALASPSRLELLDLLCQGPRHVDSLAEETGQSVANASKHLRVLLAAQLLESERDGNFVTYRVADQRVVELALSLRGLAESRLVEVESITKKFFGSTESAEPLERAEFERRLAGDEILVLDVRPRQEYDAGHIPGAVSMPVLDLKKRLTDLPRDRGIVAYCRGPYCVMAVEAVELLRSKGYDAVRFEEGVPEWAARGREVEVGAENDE